MVEILVSAFILAMLVVPMFNTLVAGRMLAAHRGEKRMALGLVERKVEQLMAAGYGSPRQRRRRLEREHGTPARIPTTPASS